MTNVMFNTNMISSDINGMTASIWSSDIRLSDLSLSAILSYPKTDLFLPNSLHAKGRLRS